MALRITWRGYDPFIHRLSIALNVYGQKNGTGEGEHARVQDILALVLPRFVWTLELRGEEWVERVVDAYVRSGDVPEDAKAFREEIMGIFVPEEAVKTVKEGEQAVKRALSRVEGALTEVCRRIHGERAVSEEIAVYTQPHRSRDGAGATLLTEGVVALSVGTDSRAVDSAVRVLLREIVRVFNRRSGIRRILDEVSRRTGVPVEDVFNHTVADLVLWKAGVRRGMFGSYYDGDREEMREIEDEVRGILREWWLNGGDLRRMLEGRLGRKRFRSAEASKP